MFHQVLYDIAQLCYYHGVRSAVVGAGSRSAPLVLAFARHPHLKTLCIPDERSAGFVALGRALLEATPEALICTSGTAALNFAPAIAEAYCQEVPLLVLTADRPPEWIGQLEGQSLAQRSLYQGFVKARYTLPDHYALPAQRWHLQRLINEALLCAKTQPKGPVHVNVPLRKPFYPSPDHKANYTTQVPLIRSHTGDTYWSEDRWNFLEKVLKGFKKVLLVVGQRPFEHNLHRHVQDIAERFAIPVVGEITANLHQLPEVIDHLDGFLPTAPKRLAPDLLISFGLSTLSKSLKHFLGKHSPRAHFYVRPAPPPTPDPFGTLTDHIPFTPAQFLNECLNRFKSQPKRSQKSFYAHWHRESEQAKEIFLAKVKQAPFGMLRAVQEVMRHLPHHAYLHLGNSMPVRYANWIGITGEKAVEVFANRGTSGIDGCMSTAMGIALASPHILNVLLIGDISFFYDQNALFHTHPVSNLRIIMLNDQGGGIFRLLADSADLPERDTHFVMQHKRSARATAEQHNLEYQCVNTKRELLKILPDFMKMGKEKSAILEVKTNPKVDQEVYQTLFKQST